SATNEHKSANSASGPEWELTGSDRGQMGIRPHLTPIGRRRLFETDSSERGPHLFFRHIIDDGGRPDRGWQYEVQSSGNYFFIVLHRFENLAYSNVGDRRQRAEARNEIRERLTVAIREGAAGRGKVGRDEHAVRHRFAVAVPAVLRHRLECMSGGVAEIQNAARPRLVFVGRND